MIDSHSPMRVTRRMRVVSSAAKAFATIGITAQAKPEPSKKNTKNTVCASVSAARYSAP